jgi:8-oxo-dGTP pyrophosphatase MutT (NUDIX family)
LKLPPLTPWEVLEHRQLLQRSFLNVWEDHVRLANGHEIGDFCVVQSPDWAAALCITPERQIVLVRQYRHGLRAPSLELPAGALEKDEDPLPGAQRELLEETGYSSASWQHVLSASVDPARQTATAHFFCALDARRDAVPRPDVSEDLQTVLLSRAELLSAIESGQLVHAIHIAGILMAEQRGLL